MTHPPGRTSRLLGRPAKVVVFGVLATLWACETESVLARAAGHELTVDHVVEMLARENAMPNQADVVDALANLWVDYTLVAVSASEDPQFTTINLDALLQPQFNQQIINLYINSVLRPDTAISEEDLRGMWEADPPADSVRVQHILLALPDPVTQAQVDSLLEFAAQLKVRATEGESFEALAGQYSEDSGSAIQGGDIGFFSVGVMVPSFEEAAFSMAVGEVSDPVLSPLGLHVIKVTDRKAPSFEAARDSYRDSIILGRLLETDSIFFARVDEEDEIEVEAGAVEAMRQLAMNPRVALGARAASRALVSYRGGSYSASDALLLLNTRQVDLPAQLAAAPDEALLELLHTLGQEEVLLARAAEAGISLAEQHVDSLDLLTRQGLVAATDELGIRGIPRLAGETADDAIARTLLQILRELTAGTLNVVPMSGVSWSLRRELDWDIFESAIGATVERVDDLVGSTGMAAPQPVVVPRIDAGRRPPQEHVFPPGLDKPMGFSSERFVLLVATLFLIPSPGEGQQLQQGINIVERVVAVVGDSMISQTQIDESLLAMEARGWTRPTGAAELLEARLEILDQLINLQLIVQEAAKDSLLAVSEEELEDRVQVQVDGQVRQFGTLARLQQALAEQNMTLALYREQQKNLIRQQVLQERYFAKRGRSSANVVVTDEEARAYFDENQDLFPDRPETFVIETIQLEPEATDAVKAVALARADSVLGLILEGGDFAELAVRFTDEPGDTGGELGWIRKDGSFVEEFEEVAFGIPDGVPSRPVETQFGYHIILVERIRGGERRVRHILFSPEITTSDVEANDARAESFADRLRAGETTILSM